MDAELKAELRRINEKLSFLIGEESKRRETWVKVSVVKQKTVWKDKNDLHKARKQGLLKQRKGKGGIYYLLESIPQEFMKPQLKLA